MECVEAKTDEATAGDKTLTVFDLLNSMSESFTVHFWLLFGSKHDIARILQGFPGQTDPITVSIFTAHSIKIHNGSPRQP